MDFEKATAELPILRELIDFLNQQVGVYCNSIAGFEGNKGRVERQVARITFPKTKRFENGKPIIVWDSAEDPTSPDVIHHRVITAEKFMKENSEAGFNEQQLCWSIVVFVYHYWDEQVRPTIAKIRGVEPQEVKINAFGDLRLLRNSIIHNKGILTATDYDKLIVLKSICTPETKILLTHDQMHSLFVVIKQGISELILTYTGLLPGAPKPEEIVGIAMQNVGKN